jgi:hypothetical protein
MNNLFKVNNNFSLKKYKRDSKAVLKDWTNALAEFMNNKFHENDDGTVLYVKQAVGVEEITELDYAATVNIDASKNCIFELTLTGNVTSINISNAVIGSYLLIVHQDSIGSRTMAFNSTDCKFPSGSEFTVTAAASSTDIFSIFYDGDYFYINAVQDYQTV